MAAVTTIQDLPDDMLHEIFGHVLAAEPGKHSDLFGSKKVFFPTRPPEGAHLALRGVCRRWRDIADWVRLSTSTIFVETAKLADAGAVRARHPAAFKRLLLACPPRRHSTSVSRAAASLINGSADLRRALLALDMTTCCLPSLLRAVTPITSCTALTELGLAWSAHKKERVVPPNMLAPLSALRMLKELVYGQAPGGDPLSPSALLAPLPALPDAPCLTCLSLNMIGNFVPVGSDAALGRLRRVDFRHLAPVQALLDAEDPFLLRAAFDAGTWRPSRLTGLQNMVVNFHPVSDSRSPLRLPRTGSRSGSEWAPLAGQVTSLHVNMTSDGFKRPSTGIVAGLGALTALRDLQVQADISSVRPGRLEPVFIDRVRAPHLTKLRLMCTPTTVSAARFPNLVILILGSVSHQPPLNLRSLVARSSLKTLALMNCIPLLPGFINVAELFAGGGGWPVLETLVLENMVLEWDATDLDGAPTAAEFAERARQLLPALFRVGILEPHGPAALPDRSRVGFVVACRRHVVPALLGLHVGRD